jgi:tRNA1(Val) A37 N6-methylase TrmN6
MLRWGGSFCLVHKPERLTDLCCTLRAAGLEPKRLREVCKQAGSAPSLLLMEARRGGKPGLTIQPPLLLRNADGSPTAELDAIYFRSTEDTP